MTKPIIASALLILFCLHSPADVAIQTPRTTQRSLSHSLSARLIPPDFYQVIIDNNLFRPLGWRKPKPAPTFELIATVTRRNGIHKALIRNVKTRKLRYAAVGEKLAPGVTLENVEPRAVTLNQNGTSKVYRLSL